MMAEECRNSSFKEKLIGKPSATLVDEDEWVTDDEEETLEDEDDPECPVMLLSKEEKCRIRQPWKLTLIINLLGRSIGYTVLLRKIIKSKKPGNQVLPWIW